jgi:hypothetical protein
MNARTYSAAALLTAAMMLTLFRACTSISIAPECPAEMQVGESRQVFANEQNPGAIARYLWEVFPPDRGSFSNATLPDPRFQALKEGEVVLRLTASDGLYQVISECRTRVQGFVGVAVRLTAMPPQADLREPVTLTCESVGSTEAVRRDIVQTEGGLVDLVEISEGVARFEADRIGDLVFRCVGENAAGDQSEPTFITVNVTGANVNGNRNGNANGNDNALSDAQTANDNRDLNGNVDR